MKLQYKSLLIGLSLGALVACGSNKDTAHHGHAETRNGTDLQEKTAAMDTLPKFLDHQREEIRLVYQLAAANAELLQVIPCYCGCGESAGHISNKNCFIKQINEDGSVVWDDHGTRCGVCLNIAVESAKMNRDGKTAKEIRVYVDTKYKNGFAKPTNTPMPL